MREAACRILDEQRRRLQAIVPGGELSLTGGSSLADALTFGDIDLHLRTPEEGFDLASEAISRGYAVVHQEIWQHGLATFEIAGADPPIGIALTAIDGEHDRLFRRTWQLLASDPGLLTAYNEMKRRHRGSDPAAYRAAKSDFFAGLTVEPAKSQP
jgi:hypothetical protein